jgi:hypothetical protein
VFGWLDLFRRREAIRWRILVGLYLSVAVGALLAVNADQNNAPAALGLVGAVSLLVGWGTGSGWGAVVPWMLIPPALLLGHPDTFTGGGDTDPLVLLALVSAAISTALILAAAGARILYRRRHVDARTAEARAAARRAVRDADAAPSAADLLRMDERARPSRDRGAQKKRSIRHPTGHRR